MSKITVSLRDLVGLSEYIFHVKKSRPFVTEEERLIHEDKKRYPPFIMNNYHYEIVEILYGPDENLKSECITVLPAYFEQSYIIHKGYWLEGKSKTPFWQFYKSGIDYYGTDELILFLRSHREKYKLAVVGAYESVSRKHTILRMIGEPQQSNGV